MTDLSEPQRQSPFAIVMIGVRVVRSLGIVQLLVAIAVIIRWAADGRLLFAIVVVGALFLTVSALSWWRYTFQFVDSELVVTSGVLRADRLTVPVGRIQSVAVEQELLHRLTGLVKVVIDTAGSSQAEFTIDAVARPVADELQRRVGTARPGGALDRSPANEQSTIVEERIVFQHDTRRLVVTALTMSPLAGLALLVPLLALSQEALEPIVDRLTRRCSGGDCRLVRLVVGAAHRGRRAGVRGAVEPRSCLPHRLATGAAHRRHHGAPHRRTAVPHEHRQHSQPGAGDDQSAESTPTARRAPRHPSVQRRFR